MSDINQAFFYHPYEADVCCLKPIAKVGSAFTDPCVDEAAIGVGKAIITGPQFPPSSLLLATFCRSRHRCDRMLGFGRAVVEVLSVVLVFRS